ncbi:MAG: hypothetical protein KAU95_03130, partial [Candidatus Aenigmarchaeota archaeon]|nr:hypothetical protein [Candidatus Aenigmarchaeota archaeon]
EYESSEKPKTNKIIYLLIGFALLLICALGFAIMTLYSGSSVCGDGICKDNENCYDCSDDCICKNGEICSKEKKRCIKLEELCGNGKCDISETCSNCPEDCGTCATVPDCGDGICNAGETYITCPKDCLNSIICGDKVCEENETQDNCCVDCGCPTGEKCLNRKCIKVEICGDGICNDDENCYECPKDCKCNEGEYCSEEEKKCVKPTCGDGNCEPYENSDDCCLDCGCAISGEICNEITKKCEMPEMSLTDERAIELTMEYFENQSLEVLSTEVTGISAYDNKLVKNVKIEISGEEWLRYTGVTEDEEVIEFAFS